MRVEHESRGSSPLAVCIEVGIRPGRKDVLAARLANAAQRAGLRLPDGLSTRRGWSLNVQGDRAQAERLAQRLLADPVMNTFVVRLPSESPAEPDTRRLEVMRRAGVMDPSARSVTRAAAALGVTISDVRSWQAYVLPGDPSDELLEQLGYGWLANEIVEEVRVDPEQGVAPAPTLPDTPHPRTVIPLRDANDAELQRLSEEGVLALDLVEMRTVQAHFRSEQRDPTDLELETIAQTWSEHCKHKTLTGLVDYEGERWDNLLKSTIARATHELDRDFCVSVFVDNAGVVKFDDEHHLTFKVETHNHPSALEPYGGAGTGLGGVIRDTMGTGLGAKPIVSTDVFCFGPHDLPAADLPPGCQHPSRIMEGVVHGVRDYGNRMGIPTVNGAVFFDERYVANPLVYAGSVGLIPAGMVEKAARPGDLVVVLGGATGRDGIHGATFSSLELHDESETMSSGAVQIGNAIEEKQMLDVLLAARDRGLYSGITDCGAGGLSSAVGEMGELIGAEVHLERVPLKYHGLSYTEIWISEAQERMVVSVPPEHEAELLALFASEDVPATVIGTFTNDKRLRAHFHGEEVMNLSMEFLHDGLPQQERQATRRVRDTRDPAPLAAGTHGAMLKRILAAPNVASKAWVVRQYDHEVQCGSVIKPFVGPGRDGPSDGAVTAPVLGSRRAFALGCGLAPWAGDVDPYRMALLAIDEALRNAVAVGGDPEQTAILDNFSWGNCEKPDNLGDLVEACKACYDGAMAFRTPFISGKDSLNNDYRVGDESRSIPPTLLISALSQVDDAHHACSMDLKQAEHEIVLVGSSGTELGGSHLARLQGELGAEAPLVDLERAPRVMAAVHAAIERQLVAACHDLSEGGLAVAAAEMAFAGGLGMELTLDDLPVDGTPDLDRLLFAEAPTRFLLEVERGQLDALLKQLKGLPHAVIGVVSNDARLSIRHAGSEVIDEALDDLRAAFLGTLDLDGEHDPQ
ncbi:MAG: phosphoribosylformylglycinamidine synthase subunit PurL [Planctomycetota bacterium]|nr:MAG: phosphoribosylformylglycinamidine synthase subunit PurL [Planctomycetota bacterium]